MSVEEKRHYEATQEEDNHPRLLNDNASRSQRHDVGIGCVDEVSDESKYGLDHVRSVGIQSGSVNDVASTSPNQLPVWKKWSTKPQHQLVSGAYMSPIYKDINVCFNLIILIIILP